MISIGNEIRIMRQDNAAIERKSKVCCTPTQNDGTLSQKMDVKQNKMSVSEMRCYKRIIDKSTLDSPRYIGFNNIQLLLQLSCFCPELITSI